MPHYKGRIRRQHSFQQGDSSITAPATTSGSDADLESLISMDTFTDARSSPSSLNGHQVRESADRQTTSSTHPLIDHRVDMNNTAQTLQNRRRNEPKTWSDYLPGFLKRRRRGINNAPTIIYTDNSGNASVQSNIKMEENGNGGPKMRRLSPAKSRSRSIEPRGCYFSDGTRLIDYVLVYDLDSHEDSDNADEEKEVP
ncbi:hypothetical protein M3Y97_01087800 [Aphelenchoides bicaudatus]|nr:hypothetical protein M3Y97_01087800 [Aphelenchoides bicaudatus]